MHILYAGYPFYMEMSGKYGCMREDGETGAVAAYVRASTDRQESKHQRDDIEEWADLNGIDPASIDWYVDLAQSGSDPGREQFQELIDAIESGEYDRVIVWEISRLARLGSIYQRFFEVSGDNSTVVNITNGVDRYRQARRDWKINR